ncbi:SDR family NAD(P)-dependent oxidoreductase [Clostridium lundense]|uniref:SDR family NAD(P)-dependent oxidoreductase n=1 Tax=Clostridium lundense TaxID=319475 RepID=UPI00048368E7|nr:SDR family NAD(P)-dependent oxidoreductase [Clostridium lundense]
MENKNLENQIAIVTGGGSGIGREICLSLAKRGAKIMVTDINEKGMEETKNLIEDNGGYAETYKLDVVDSDMVKNVMDAIYIKHNRIDILISNAGISTPPSLGTKMSEEHWDKLIKVHLYGTFNCVKACGEYMKANNYGRIVLSSSLGGVFGFAGNVNYAVAKTGMVGMTYTLAKELGPYGITVNVIQPGIIRTPMTSGALKVFEEGFIKETPVRRIGEVGDVSNAIAFFCMPESSFITGVVMRIDGGYILQSSMDQIMIEACSK